MPSEIFRPNAAGGGCFLTAVSVDWGNGIAGGANCVLQTSLDWGPFLENRLNWFSNLNSLLYWLGTHKEQYGKTILYTFLCM